MLAAAGQTAGPNMLECFEEAHGYLGEQNYFLISRATPGTLASKYIIYYKLFIFTYYVQNT